MPCNCQGIQSRGNIPQNINDFDNQNIWHVNNVENLHEPKPSVKKLYKELNIYINFLYAVTIVNVSAIFEENSTLQ